MLCIAYFSQMYRYHISTAGIGGVICYVFGGLSYCANICRNFDDKIWVLGINLKSFNVLLVCRSPAAEVSWSLEIFNELLHIIKLRRRVLIADDFNVDINVQTTYTRRFLEQMDQFGYRHLVHEDTRVTKCSSTRIDLVFSNTDNYRAGVLQRPVI